MPFLLLLLLALACLPDNWDRPWLEELGLGRGSFALLTWSAMAFMVVAAAQLARRPLGQLLGSFPNREEIYSRFRRSRYRHLLALVVIYGLALYVLGWGWTVRSLGPAMSADDFIKKYAKHGQNLVVLVEDAPSEFANHLTQKERDLGKFDKNLVEAVLAREPFHQMFLGAELLILAPFLVALVASWACFYEGERIFHDTAAPAIALTPFWSRRAYLLFHLRHHLALIFVVIGLLVIQKELSRLSDFQESIWFKYALLSLMVVVLAFFPWVLRIILGLKPLPASPLRERLMAAAHRLRFRFSNILLWNTNGAVANAMVAGIVPQVRYVVLTDRLINDLTPDEVEAVFGHEVGHIKHHHMAFYLTFIVISLSTLSVVATLLRVDEWFKSNEDMAIVPMIGILGGYIFVVFGFLSRRCERQADIFGCRTMSCTRADCTGHDGSEALAPRGRGLCATGISTFIDALEKVARLNGISRHRPGWLQSWQHSTIAHRVEFLQRVRKDPSIEPRFQRTVRIVKWSVVILLAATLMMFSYWQAGKWIPI
jgi:Zn-dependent protease with chaperone function